jgi:hypothetical protein
MSVEYKNGLGFSQSNNNGRIFIAQGMATYSGDDSKPYLRPDDINTDFSSTQWSNWGDDNLLPKEMANHIENCGVLNVAMDAKARIAQGKGIQPFLLLDIGADGKEVTEWLPASEILDFLEDNSIIDFGIDSNYDEYSYGWSCGSFVLNKKGDAINKVRRIDVHTARVSKYSKKNIIDTLFLSTEWEKASTSFDEKKQVKLPVLEEGREYYHLLNQAKGNQREFAFLNRKCRDGRLYYPLPLWWSAKEWVKIARSIPKFKNAMFANQISIKYVITVSDKYWEIAYGNEFKNYTTEERDKLMNEKYDEIDAWLTGEEKAYKSISTGTYYNEEKGEETPLITITVVDDKIKDGKLLPDSSAANSEILFAAMVQPSFIGAGQPGGPYSNNAGGSNVRESHLSQIMITEPERRHVTNILNIVKRFNGWDKKYEKERTITTADGGTKIVTPRLVFRNLSGILTTLDTGKSTKAENI